MVLVNCHLRDLRRSRWITLQHCFAPDLQSLGPHHVQPDSELRDRRL